MKIGQKTFSDQSDFWSQKSENGDQKSENDDRSEIRKWWLTKSLTEIKYFSEEGLDTSYTEFWALNSKFLESFQNLKVPFKTDSFELQINTLAIS
jgi:hypothetical protein